MAETTENQLPEIHIQSIPDTGEHGLVVDGEITLFSTRSRVVANVMIRMLEEKFQAVYDQGYAGGKDKG